MPTQKNYTEEEERILFRTGGALLALIPIAYTFEALSLMVYAKVVYGIMAVICFIGFYKGLKTLKHGN